MRQERPEAGAKPQLIAKRPPGREEKMKRRAGVPEGFNEDISMIIPEFSKYSRVFFILDCALALACLAVEICYFLASRYNSAVTISDSAYIVQHIAVPSTINLLVVLIMALMRKKTSESDADMRQNLIPLFGMIIICMSISISHYSMTVTLFVFVIPIFMMTLFSNRSMCKKVSTLCMCGALIATVRHLISAPDGAARSLIGIESVVALVILFMSTQVALTLLSMTTEQKSKMFEFVKTIKEAQMRADAANHAKSAFLANMSHEIRTPINAILGMDEMILRESKNDEITEYAETIYSASTSLLYLVNDVLDISKIESGKLEITENTYGTASLVHDCCNMINEKAAKKGLALKVFCNPNLPSKLKGDEVHLRQIVTNLLSNAYKYTEKGSITLAVDQQRKDGRYELIISVKDTGIGIAKENVSKLFSQFSRFDLEKNRTIEGTGLGLSITKQLVDLMQGEISVESTYGAGSTFRVVLPQQIVDDSPMGNFDERYHEVISRNTTYRKGFEAPDAKILVVDDVEGNLKVVVNLLKQTKVWVDTAISGKVCLEKITRVPYDIIFMDHMMPEMSGIETYEKMKEMEDSLNKNTPVIMLTANAITGVQDEYMKAGFTDYMSKPVLGEKLERMIEKYLPDEKIHYGQEKSEETAPKEEPKEEGEREPKINLVRLQDFFQEYPNLDMMHGLSHFGQNTNLYISSLHMFGRQLDTASIKAFFKANDAEKYEMLLHDIKRAAYNLGFFKLSEQAEELEKAAGKKDWDYISEKNDAFVSECNVIAAGIKKHLERRN